MRKRCVICYKSDEKNNNKFVKFPSEVNRCREWVRLVGEEDLVYVPIEKLTTIRYICFEHFDKKCITKKGNLKKTALPTLKLTAPPISNILLQEFPCHWGSNINSSKEKTTCSHNENGAPNNKIKLDENADTPRRAIPESSSVCTSSSSMALQLKSNLGLLSSVCTQELNERAPTSRMTEDDKNSDTPRRAIPESSSVCIRELNERAPTSRMTEDDKNSDTPRRAMPESSSVCTQELKQKAPTSRTTKDDKNSEMTPRERILLKKLQKAKRALASFKKSAAMIEKIDSPLLKQWAISNCKNQKRKANGRRWTMEEKMSCLAIMKQSTKSYMLLRKEVPLPSIRTLQNISK